jgi:1-phosphatidylinositol-3-phosphate 5-kinase
VASARATVEVLDSVKDAIKDESDSSDPSSEADDEDEGVEEERTVPELITESPEADSTSPEGASKTAPPGASFSEVVSDPETRETEVLLPGPVSLPPSPFLSSTKNDVSLTPPTSDLELGTSGAGRPSILKAISGFWLQPPPISRLNDDPMSDPEHIFRDSSMVVRTDEPTSIIALALKYLLFYILSPMLTSAFTVRLNTVTCLLDLVLRNGPLVKQG